MSDRGRLFLIADAAEDHEELQDLLVAGGYSVVRSSNDVGLLNGIVEAEPDLVLLDVHLKDADAFDLAIDLRESTQARDIPLIFVAGPDDADVRVKGLQSGDDLLVTPFDSREVLARVERQVTVSRVRMALRESEAKFRSVMESAIDAIISADAEGLILSWNSAARALFGFTEDEVLGRPIDLIIPERYRDQHRAGIKRVSSGGPSHVIGQTVELAAVTRDGSEFPVELSLATWHLDDARYYTGIIRDITERKQAEQKFRSVTDSAIDAIISADQNGEVITWNQAATRILGYTEEEAVGQRLELIIPDRFQEAHRTGMARFTATGEARAIGRTVELFARRKDGEEVPIELSLSTWTVKSERYFTGIIRDIGERKRAEEALRASEQALRENTEELEDTLHRLREAQDQLLIQEKMASLGKLSAGMAHELNNPASTIKRGAAHLRERFQAFREIELEMTRLGLDDKQVQRVRELDRASRERSEQGEALGALARSDREAELEEWCQERDFENLDDVAPALVNMRYRGADLETLANEFSVPQFRAVIRRLSVGHEIECLVQGMRVGTERIVEVVSALKTFTHMDRVGLQPVDLHQSLEDTLVMLGAKVGGDITVVREFDDRVPLVQAHAGELNQVWMSIIDNALDALDEGGTITLRTRREDLWIVVELEDDGPGIPAEIQSNIFDPFFTTKPPGSGTGLGLSVSHTLVVQKYHGRIEVRSRPGCTRFEVCLPVE